MGHGKNHRWSTARVVLCAGALMLAALLLAPAPASAGQVHLFKERFGPAAQPGFGAVEGLAVERSSGDLYVADAGADEQQSVKVAASAGAFRLCFEAQCTPDLPFSATAEEVKKALWALSTVGEQDLSVEGGPGDGAGAHPYLVAFTNKLRRRDLPQLVCENGSTPLSGGSGCTVTTARNGVPETLSRYHEDGTPAPFSGLGTNTIDGKAGPGGKPCAEEAASCDVPSSGAAFRPLAGASRTQIAIDESAGKAAGDIYIAEPDNQVVTVFAASGKYLGRITASGFVPLGEACGVAVDGAGNLYVGDYANKKIHKYVPSANPPKNTDKKLDLSPGDYVCDLALGAGPTAGFLFAATDESGIRKIELASGAVKYGFGPSEGRGVPLAVDPVSGHVLAYGNIAKFPEPSFTRLLEYDASGATEATLASTTAGLSALAIATPNGGGNLYLNVSGKRSEVDLYGPAVTVPAVETKAATAITPTKATLNGTVNPDGGTVSECYFQYVTREQWLASKFASAASISCEGSIPADHSPHAVSARVTGLKEHELYEFRILAAEECEPLEHPGEQCLPGELHPGSEGSLEVQLPRTAVTGEALEVGGTSAILTGTVNPDGTPVSDCHFSYLTDASFTPAWTGATDEPCAEYEAGGTWHQLNSLAELGEGEEPVPVRAKVTGLQTETKYRFRLVASNGNVSGSGAEQGKSLTTLKTVETKPATEIGGHIATLNGTVNPFAKAVSECFFEYGPSAEYGQIAPCAESEAEIGTGSTPVAVHADIGGLDSTSSYHFRLVATIDTETDFGQNLSFETLGPRIEAQWVSAVTAGEAILRAKIDPEGSPTSYRLIWGPAGNPEEHEIAPAPVGEDSSPHTVSVPLTGLAPDAEYSYRFSATANCNEAAPAEECEVEAPEGSFTTYPLPEPQGECPNQAFRTGPAATLPDCRAYELVSPLDKNGGGVAEPGALLAPGMPAQSSLSGERLAFGSSSSFAGPRSANFKNQYIASRGATGWTTESIVPPLETPGVQNQPFGVANAFYAYSPDLSSAWFWNENAKPLTPDAQPGHSNLYRREDATGAYEALSVAAPANEPNGPFGPGLAGKFVGASDNLSQQFFETRAPLTANADPGNESQIYDFSSGGLTLVSVLPDGTADPANSEAGSSIPGASLPSGYGAIHHAVSSDGSRVFWTSNPTAGTVYVRQNPDHEESAAKDGEGDCLPEAGKACTVQLSPGSNSIFLTATPEGSKALLLTDGSLEVVDADNGAASTVAAGLPSFSEAQSIDTGFLGASADLSRIYLVSTEALAPGASEGADNLYLWHEGDFSFIGALSAADVSGDNVHSFRSPVGLSANAHDARVSPDGTSATFVSGSTALAEAAAGYDNRDAKTGAADREAYLYDAGANGGEGRLNCVSCNPSGARPRGEVLPSPVLGKEPPTAALIPIEPSVYHTSRPLSDDGSKVFFESFDPLLPLDTDGTWDVYEWEAPGHGTCREADPDYFARDGGCLSLISTGTDPEPSEFFDADPEAKNVFIRTVASIDPRDEGAYDLYDAREGGGFALPTAPAPCEGEACQSPPAPPDDPTPSSESFRGKGNLGEGPAGCAKGKRRVKGRCVARQRKHAHRRHHRAGRRRGAGR